jgi:hypothetical protein
MTQLSLLHAAAAGRRMCGTSTAIWEHMHENRIETACNIRTLFDYRMRATTWNVSKIHGIKSYISPRSNESQWIINAFIHWSTFAFFFET